MPQQILETNHERKSKAAGARLVHHLQDVDRSATFHERPDFRVTGRIDGEVTAAPGIDIVGADCGVHVPLGLRFFDYGGQRKRIINQPSEHARAARKKPRECRNNAAVRLFFAAAPLPSARMNKTVVEVQVRAVLPTSGGCAVFLGNNDKVFIIYVDQTVGSAITMFMRDVSKERPLTHDLMGHLMTALGAKVERVIINDLKNATYYARMIIAAENELQQKKIIELDGRPSDCIAMATQQKAPMYVSQEVWDEVDDMSDVLRKMEEDGLKPDVESESESESTEEE